MSDNPSFVLKAIDHVVFEERPVPDLGPNDVLVEVKKTGICGSDVHYLVHGKIGDFVVENPMACFCSAQTSSYVTLTSAQVLGHESSGVVCKGVLLVIVVLLMLISCHQLAPT
jgi:D-xylulose reductase